MADQILLVNKEGGVVTLTLNSPENRNALSLELIGAVTATLKALPADSEARVVVIKGAGQVFSSGHNLSELIDRKVQDYRRVFSACQVMMNQIHQIPQPVIAQVHGAAFAAGCQLVAACDLALAAEGTRFSTPGVRLGLFCNTPSVPLTRCVGRKKALDMLLAGRVLNAQEAEAAGLVSRVVSEERLETEVTALAKEIASYSPLTVRSGKEFFYKQIEMDEERALAYATELMAVNLETHDAQEGIKAFLEKRAPVWKGE